MSTITISFTAPVELSIKIEEYMENHDFKARSPLIRIAITKFLEEKEKSTNTPEVLNEIYNEVLQIKKLINK